MTSGCIQVVTDRSSDSADKVNKVPFARLGPQPQRTAHLSTIPFSVSMFGIVATAPTLVQFRLSYSYYSMSKATSRTGVPSRKGNSEKPSLPYVGQTSLINRRCDVEDRVIRHRLSLIARPHRQNTLRRICWSTNRRTYLPAGQSVAL